MKKNYNREKKYHKFQPKAKVVIMALVLGIVFCGCTQSAEQNMENMELTEDATTTPYIRKKADSLDEAVISKINESKEQITFFNTTLGMNYTLSYKGINSIKDKYEQELSISQLTPGDLVIVSFVKEDKEIRTIQLKKDAFIHENVSNYEINETARTMFIEDKQYEFAKNLFVFANGKAAKLTDINMVDVLKVSGTDRVINSIVVDKGHGYIRLTNDEYFIGGWIEVGENLIKPIYKDMLLTVPEGEYEILITNKGYGGTKGVVVEANKETVVDVGDLKGDEVKTGKIIFTITPASATVEIDGKQVDLSSPVTLEYGIHQIVLQAEGYKTMTKYIKVGAALANMDIEMEEGTSSTSENTVKTSSTSTSTNKKTSSTTSTSNQTNSTSKTSNKNTSNKNTSNKNNSGTNSTVTDTDGTARVYIDAPEGTQLYVDGEYVGIVPTSFKKVSGNHEVSFRKEGYETRSYTLYFEEDDKNLTFSFAGLSQISE